MPANEQVESGGGRERRLRRRVGDELESNEESATADVTDLLDIGEAFLDRLHEPRTVGAHPLDEAVALDDALDGETGRAGERVAGERVSRLRAADRVEHGRDSVVIERRAERHVAAAEALRDRHHVGDDTVVLERSPCAAATGAAHHLVGDHQHAVAVAHVTNHPCVPRRSWDRTAGRADHRLEDEAGDVVGTETDDLAFELVGARGRDVVRGNSCRWAVGVDRRDVRSRHECTLVRARAAP